MYFKFNYTMNDQDYIDFNVFLQTNTEEGKLRTKQIMKINVFTCLMFCWAFYLITKSWQFVTILFVVYMILFIVKFACKEQNAVRSTKRVLKFYEKTGKKLYAQNAVMEFTDESFIETTNGIKTEVLYSVVKKMNVLNGRYILFDINRNEYFILPFRSFSSNEECTYFIDFLRTKIQNVEFY